MDLNKLIKELPHKFPMLMIDEVLETDDKKAVTRSIIKPTNPFIANDSKLSEYAFIELMAQTLGLQIVSYYARTNLQAPSLGFLLGIRSLEYYASLSINDEITVTAVLEHSKDKFKNFRCTINKGKKVISEGVIKVYEQD